eukprot:2944697-Rhodomonas_salina.3
MLSTNSLLSRAIVSVLSSRCAARAVTSGRVRSGEARGGGVGGGSRLEPQVLPLAASCIHFWLPRIWLRRPCICSWRVCIRLWC